MPSTISYLTADLPAFPIPATAISLLLNSEFNDPFTGDELTGWQSSGGWAWNSLGYADAAYGAYLYQRVSGLIIGANYRVIIGVSAYTSGQLNCFMTNQAFPAPQNISATGELSFTFNASVQADRFHIWGQNGFNGQVDYVRLIRL